jgi:general secretion pathway protein D
MEITMKLLLRGLLVASMLAFAMTASSQGASDSSASASAAPAGDSGVPISKIIAVVAKKTGKKFIVDPRVEAGIHLVGQDVASVDYPGLLAMLRIYNVAALEEDGYVFVIPDARIRQMPLPLISDGDRRSDVEYANAVIHVKTVPASQLVPILRPLLPQSAHLAALPCVNNLLMVDSVDNIRRIEALIRALDTGGEVYKTACRPKEAQEETTGR